jgi:hypothetical protein
MLLVIKSRSVRWVGHIEGRNLVAKPEGKITFEKHRSGRKKRQYKR